MENYPFFWRQALEMAYAMHLPFPCRTVVTPGQSALTKCAPFVTPKAANTLARAAILASAKRAAAVQKTPTKAPIPWVRRRRVRFHLCMSVCLWSLVLPIRVAIQWSCLGWWSVCLEPAMRVVCVHVTLLVMAQAANIHKRGQSYIKLNRESLQWATVCFICLYSTMY